MSAERDAVDALLASISDGSPVDWEAARKGATPAERERLAAMREMANIAEFNRGLQRGAHPQEAGPAASAPERWGELLLLERIGSGARADVYRAWDPALRREVALKLMRPGTDDAALLDEGRAAARVRHPHVVTVHGIDEHDGRVGLWMELVRGATLDHEVRTRGASSVADVSRLAAEIGGALAAVHEAGLIHRDVTPANIVRDREGRFVLADFGLGLRGDDAAKQLPGLSGTPMYMAPELLAGGTASERSDQYALGMVLWFAIAGRHPFEEKSLEALTEAVRRGPTPSVRTIRAELPPALAAAVERAIAPAPEARYANVRSLVAALETALRARHGRTALIAGAFVGVMLVAALLRRPGHAPERESVPPPAPATAQAGTYSVVATMLRQGTSGASPISTGDRVKPGDRLSLEVRASLPAWVYVLNEDERGERYLLFPQPRLDVSNPLPADSALTLPGPIGGVENAWSVTSAGGREHFLLVVSPEPVAEIEADLARIPAARPGRPIVYAPIGEAAIDRLRGVGGMVPMPKRAPAARANGFDSFRALAGRESGVRGIWVRQIVLENPAR
jgi:hypothetical protein